MIINLLLITSNPFLQAFSQADWLGKFIFISLLTLSIVTWSLLIFKWRILKECHKSNKIFEKEFQKFISSPLELEWRKKNEHDPFYTLYRALKKSTLEILHRNQDAFEEVGVSMLSPTDLQFVEGQLDQARKKKRIFLEKNLFVLATVVTLAPFLGLLGTVWGILDSFSHLQVATGNTNQLVLGGLSLALATTVLGLLDAIPALVGYNYLRNKIKEMDGEMEHFSHTALAAVELQYRQVDV